MASQLQLRRGTTVQHVPFIGAPAEVTVDTDKKTLVVHDGSTAGGFPSATAAELSAGLATKVSIGAAAGGALSGTYPNPTLAPVIATGSTTPRFVADRFAETIKVADFGAVGDGVTDDAAAIQAAINLGISKGNAVIEFEPKTYRLTASKAHTQGNIWPLVWGWNHLEINGGTPTLRLRFKGNGARLFTDTYLSVNTPANRIAMFFAVTTEADELIWEDITFERGAARRATSGFQGGNAFICSRPVGTSYMNRVAFRGCKFINGFMGAWDNRGFSISKTWRKLRSFETINCDFIQPYGSNTTAVGGGGQTINLSGWVDQHICDGCYVDCAVDAIIPNDVNYPVDGFNYVNAHSTWITNCTFKNNWVETLIFETPPNYMYRVNSFTQPAVGGQVTVTINAGDNFNEEIIAGKTYCIMDFNGTYFVNGVPSQIGIYRADTGAPNYSVGGQITFTRLPDETALLPSGALPVQGQFPAAGSVFSSNSRICLFINGEGVGGAPAASVTNCKFVGRPVKRQNGTTQLLYVAVTNGGSGYTSAPTVTINPSNGASATATISGGAVTAITLNPPNTLFWYTSPPTITIAGGGGNGATARPHMLPFRPSPGIIAKVRTTMSNNHFEGCEVAMFDNPAYIPGGQGPITFTNNIVIAQREPGKAVGQEKGIQVSVQTPCTICSNNLFIADSQDSMDGMLLCGREGQIVTNNTFWCNLPSTAGAGTFAVAIFNSSGFAEWDMVLDNIVAYGFNYALFSNVPVTYGSIRGKSVTALAAVYNDQGGSTFLKSINGTNWRIKITNDGELIVSPYTPV